MFGALNLEDLETLIRRKKSQTKRVIEGSETEGEIVEFDDEK